MVAYPHVAERLFGRPHAIEPGAFRILLESPLTRRVLSGEPEANKKPGKGRKMRSQRLAALASGDTVPVGAEGLEYGLTRDGIAIVPICGVLAQRFDWLAAACGWTTYEGLSATFDAMLIDYRVKAILLDVESPGGEVNGMLDIADKMMAARAQKPLWAVANPTAASAAYLLAGCASQLYVPRLAMVGSIGAVAVHVDQSVADQTEGLKYTAIYSGARKIDGWDHAALDSDARAVFQERVDYSRDLFTEAVGRQGRLSAQEALATEAAVYSDQQAVKAKLADHVGTFDDALAALSEIVTGRSRNSATTAAETHAVETPRSQMMTDKTTAGPVAGMPSIAAAAPAPAAAAPETAAVAAAVPAAVVATAAVVGDVYSIEAATETIELCALAGLPATRANAFISAKTPVAKVRATLAAEKADAANAHTTEAAVASPVVNAGWDKAVSDVNRQYGLVAK